ncbi:myb/SANT-like DNA-binding domain-containing protein 3 [Diabrotica undecimpunctata]|uniref:myb/SANT-like DNA-binding domain-containing protein 3 n=1 Tax=Diabrotica undecimpunctata TaxID=50387 RepID=UPI003B63E1FC
MEASTSKIFKRSANFSPEEEQVLISLCIKYKNVIECRETNAITWRQKNSAWIQLEKEFNATCGGSGYRSLKTLKEKYLNLKKKKTKKRVSENKLQLKMTGGGPHSEKPLSDIEIAVSELIGAEKMTGLPNIYDSDRDMDLHPGNMLLEVSEDVEVFSEEEIPENVPCTSALDTSWETYSAKSLQQPVAEKLSTPRGGRKDNVTVMKKTQVSKRINTKSNELLTKKIEFVDHQRKKFDEEHELRMKNLNMTTEIKKRKLELLKLDKIIKEKQLLLLEK